MNSVGRMPASTSPRRCRISAHPFTRSILAERKFIPSFPYFAATVLPRREPLPRPRVIKFVDDMNLTPERREELTGGNVPVAIEPRPFLPARQVRQDLRVLGIVEAVITHPRRNESGFCFRLLRKRE